jgi:hypothetical protein
MIKVAIPHRIYSENKVKIKNIIKKYGMSWDGGKNGWVNAATGDGVYIDRAIMDMILSDTFSGDMPMTMFVDSRSREFLAELEEKVRSIGGEVTEEAQPQETAARPLSPPAAPRPPVKAGVFRKEDVLTRLRLRDLEGCTTPELSTKAMEDLRDISRRWERRKRQVLHEYEKMGLDRHTIEKYLHREEIAFRKNNACWVTGEFPADASGEEKD